MNATAATQLDGPVIRQLISRTLWDVPEGEREEAAEEVLEAVAQIYASRGLDLPTWLAELRPEREDHLLLQAIEDHLYMEMARTPLRYAAQQHRRRVAGLAAEIGVPRVALRRFLAGSKLSAEHWEKVGAYVLANPEVIPGPGSLGLALAVSSLPMRVREVARQQMARSLAQTLNAKGVREPEWLELEQDWPLL